MWIKNIVFFKRLILGFIAFAMLWFQFSGLGLHHVWNAPFSFLSNDISYFLVYGLQLPKLVFYNFYTAMVFDVVLFGSVILAFVFSKNRAYTIFLGVFLLLYHILLNSKLGYHAHHLFGIHFALFPFYFKEKSYEPALYLSRFLICLTYFFAGFFKLIGKGWSLLSSFSEIYQNQHAATHFFYPNGLSIQFGSFLQNHLYIGWMLFVGAMFLQLSFVIGFFTQKWDKYLAFFIIAFHLSDWFLMNLGIFITMTIGSIVLFMSHFLSKNFLISK